MDNRDVHYLDKSGDFKSPTSTIASGNSLDDLTSSSTSTRSHTPEEPVTSTYLEIIDGEPASPPDYDEVNYNRHVTFPIWEDLTPCSMTEKPPAYHPTVYNVAIVSVKLEWLSPFEPSPNRSWRTFIMEINSTQINFYALEPEFHRLVKNYYNLKYDDGAKSLAKGILSLGNSKKKNDNKIVDTEPHWKRLNAKLERNYSKYLSDARLYRSFTLQYARMGIPTDYRKSAHALRLRCEAEQFLVAFDNVDDLINWSMYINMGISVALDLDCRQLPNYRVVPRRRRPHHTRRQKRTPLHSLVDNSSSSFFSKEFFLASPRGLYLHGATAMSSPPPRTRSSSSATVQSTVPKRVASQPISRNSSSGRIVSNGNNSSFGKFFDMFKSKRSKQDFKSLQSANVTGLKVTLESKRDQSAKFELGSDLEVMNNSVAEEPIKEFPTDRCEEMLKRHVNMMERELLCYSTQEPEFSEAGREVNNPGSSSDSNRNFAEAEHVDSNEDEDEDDDYTLDDDYEDGQRLDPVVSIYAEEGLVHESESDYYYEQRRLTRSRAASTASNMISHADADDVKWMPPQKILSRRRYVKDSLRCIKGFVEHSSWMGRVVCCPTGPPSFKTNNDLVLLNGKKIDEKTVGNSRNKIVNSSGDKSYWKTKNHFLQLYIIEPTGYIPITALEANEARKKIKTVLC
ncbi:PH domain-containing protein [Nakaseomyces glabratus]|nr:PH domain-containing protein [Nakaseomyces glabratus]KTB24470.1 PH domain-containing protein [Nakaseomyces glabratus]